MSIVLTILKIIGMILLILLAVFVLLVLIVLFVPVRYRVNAKKTDDPLEVTVHAGWLLNMARADGRYREKAGEGRIKVLWFTVKSFSFPDKGKGGGPAEPEEAGAPSGAGTVKKKGTPDRQTGAIPEKENGIPSVSSSRKAGEGPADAGKEQKKSGFAEKLRAVLERLPERVTGWVEKFFDLMLRIFNLPSDIYNGTSDAVERTVQKAEALYEKISPFLSIEGSHMMQKLMRYLKYLLSGYLPRRAEGFLEFGTGEPDQTGEITGLLYVLLPRGSEHYRIDPDFYEKKLRTDTTLYGHIRLCRAALVALRLVIDREFWALIRMIRHKDTGGKAGKMRRRRKKHG